MANINFAGRNGVDHVGVRGLLTKRCIACNVYFRILQKSKCSYCPFFTNTNIEDISTKKTRRRVYPGKEFSRYGLINRPAMGKHTLFYFLYNEQLNFTFPEYPEEDLLGKKQVAIYNDNGDIIQKARKFLWHIHHLNGNYWDDSVWNLLLCLNTEHGHFEAEYKKFKLIAERALRF